MLVEIRQVHQDSFLRMGEYGSGRDHIELRDIKRQLLAVGVLNVETETVDRSAPFGLEKSPYRIGAVFDG
ncbi:hypothetical protein PX554_25155 [Sphingomonas sp. H39-1-10]|uniref:hypothetical protein n=1 Tax=Sphingomonas pollutisoli TaxID=3030829 RepID=UPI0023B96B29|nr:hypothetical protein [Sphingomonas pollutisoli]MDF0491409.1 hypothetical protein [Sphingomonas pollutisoli]